MKNLAIFMGILFFCISCQEDDVCIDATSPNLVFKIYAQDSTTSVFIDTLYITYRDSDNIQDTLKLYEIDSAQIPLRIDNGPIGFQFIRIIEGNIFKDSIAMSYTPKNEYISKACGLKKVYENVNYQWIEQSELIGFQSLTHTIANTDEVHLNLYY